MFTIFHFFTVFSRLKREVETNFDLTDNMMTGTESMFLGHVLKIVEAEQRLVWKIHLLEMGFTWLRSKLL